MVSKENHPCFQPPPDKNIKIWRYMDFTKYVSLLSSKSIFFSRSDLLNDPYEGASSHANSELRPEFYKDSSITEDMFKQLSEFNEWARQWTLVNCWHMNEYESAAMWKLYAQTNEAVAIQSTYQKLFDCLPEDIYVGVVNYIDYEKEWLPEGISLWPFVHKRKSFEYECELRALIQKLPSEDGKIPADRHNQELGRVIPIDPENLIEVVYVSPDSPQWFSELVKKITVKYKFGFKVRHSILAKTPVY